MADFNRNNRFRRNFRDRGLRGPVQMHRAVCDNCGNECEVPFRPTSGRPVYCSDCFEKGNNRPKDNDQPQHREQPNYNQQFESLNKKLDNILRILETAVSEEVAEEIVDQAVVEEEAAPKVEKKKKTSKKTKTPIQE